MCVDQVSIKNVVFWYSEQLTETAHGVWFKQAAATFELRPILRSPDTDVRLLLSHAKDYFPLPTAKEVPAITVVDTKRWQKNNALIVRHLGIIAALSGETRRAAVCDMASALFDDIAEDRVRLVRSYNDVPDFEAEMKTYCIFAVSPVMMNLYLTKSELQSRGIAIEGRMRHWLGRAFSLLESQDVLKLVSGDSLPKAKRKRGFPADQQRHELINRIVLHFGEAWKQHLPDICGELESAGVSFPKTWSKKFRVRSWNEVAEEFLARGESEKRSLLVKLLGASTKWVRARHNPPK